MRVEDLLGVLPLLVGNGCDLLVGFPHFAVGQVYSPFPVKSIVSYTIALGIDLQPSATADSTITIVILPGTINLE